MQGTNNSEDTNRKSFLTLHTSRKMKHKFTVTIFFLLIIYCISKIFLKKLRKVALSHKVVSSWQHLENNK